jgi:trans-2,3-dihydro-3-hydroxyanthranilate isomerase
MRVDFVTCDVFTDRPFSGNQLLVVPDARGLASEDMQRIAREINYSESTFVLPPDDPRHAYRQRTFVPLKEIPYAGHPTVGTAVVMASLGRIAGSNGAEDVPVTIEVGFGPLGLTLHRRDGVVSRVTMEQGAPSWDEEIREVEALGKLASGIDVPYEDLLGPLRPQVVSTGNRMLMLPLARLESLSRASADPRTLSFVETELQALGVYAFAFAGNGRVRARGFFPGAGILEDPATGSAAGPLGIYLALHAALPNGSRRFFIDQGVEMGRESEIEVEVNVEESRPVGVLVSGSAVLMMRGSLEV